MQPIDTGDPLLQLLFFEHAQLYVHVACVVAAVYDNLHTLPLEVQYIWVSRVTIATILYYITRYGIYIEYIVNLYSIFTPPRGCVYTSWIVGYIFDISIWAGEALLGLRVLALCGKDRRLTYSLPVIFIALSTTSLITLAFFLNSMKYGPSPAPKIINCLITQANMDIIVTIICVVIWDILMFILLLRSACYTYKSCSQFVRVLYRDGLIYYFYTLILHAGNLVSFFVSPPEISNILTGPTRLLHAAFICRVLLYTRQQEGDNIEMTGSMYGDAPPSTSRSLDA